MRLLTIIFFIVGISFASEMATEAPPVSARQTTFGLEEKMTWNEDRPLRWTDFKGRPEPALGFVASTNSGISFSYSYKVRNGQRNTEFEVTSFFYPNESWYLEGEVNSYILKHEQTHFDISELHARKLRKRLDAATFTTEIKKEIEAIYHAIERERKSMQDTFDLESDHSKNEAEEKLWEAYVAEQLQAYERWK